MNPRITEEIRKALAEGHGEPVRIEDEQTQKVYVIIDEQILTQAMEALRQQEDIAAIQTGFDAAERGEVSTLEEVDSRIRKKMGFPKNG